MRLAEIKEDRGLAMVRTRACFAPTAPKPPGAPAQPIAFGDPVTLIRAPFHISFAYAGPDRLWLPSWKGQKQLPEAVRISVRDTIADRVLSASTVARVRVTASGAPNAASALPPARAAETAMKALQ